MNNSETQSTNEIQLSPEGIPMEFAEIPENYESAYITVSKDSIDFVSKNGFSPKFNKRHNENAEILFRDGFIQKDAENILEEAAEEIGVLSSRKNCIFSQFAPEQEEGWILKGDNKYVIEVLLDPEHARVADENMFLYVVTEATIDRQKAKGYALDYWANSVNLNEFIKNPKKFKNWNPEILYFKDIPLEHARLVHSPISK